MSASTSNPPSIAEMFDRIAPWYDLMNRLVSAGVDVRWRRRVVAETASAPTGSRLDLCAGTLDLAAMLAAAEPHERVVAVDFSEKMLLRGHAKAPRVETLVADACATGLGSGSFSVATCGFGVRNVASPEALAREALRLLVPGGRLVVLEAFRPEQALGAWLHRAYVGHAFPLLGVLVARERAAYEYFVRSVRGFMPRRAFEELLRSVGFTGVRGYDLAFGLAGIVVAEVPA